MRLPPYADVSPEAIRAAASTTAFRRIPSRARRIPASSMPSISWAKITSCACRASIRLTTPLCTTSPSPFRILWRHLQFALYTARREPQPERSWAERPLTMLLNMTRFFLASPGEPWCDLRPD